MNRHTITDWLPATSVAVLLLLVIFYVVLPSPSSKFEPLVVTEIVIEPAGPFRPGDRLIIRNGIRNVTDDPVRASIVLVLQEDTDPLVARTIPIPIGGGPSSVPIERVIPPGAVEGSSEIEAQILAIIPPGMWRLSASIIVMGNQAGQVQRVSRISNSFEVLGERP